MNTFVMCETSTIINVAFHPPHHFFFAVLRCLRNERILRFAFLEMSRFVEITKLLLLNSWLNNGDRDGKLSIIITGRSKSTINL